MAGLAVGVSASRLSITWRPVTSPECRTRRAGAPALDAQVVPVWVAGAPGEAGAHPLQLADAGGAALHDESHHRRVAEPGPGVQGVGDVGVEAVPRVRSRRRFPPAPRRSC